MSGTSDIFDFVFSFFLKLNLHSAVVTSPGRDYICAVKTVPLLGFFSSLQDDKDDDGLSQLP